MINSRNKKNSIAYKSKLQKTNILAKTFKKIKIKILKSIIVIINLMDFLQEEFDDFIDR